MREEETGTSQVFFLGLIILSLVVLATVLAFILRETRTSANKQAQDKIAQLDTKLKEKDIVAALDSYNALTTVVDHSKKIRDDRFLFLPEWNKVKQSVPSDVQFLNVAIGEDHIFRITGLTRSVSSVAKFAEALETKPDITFVTPLSLDKQSDGRTYSFNLSFQVAEAATTTSAASTQTTEEDE